jgi:hypothetical protein
MLTMRLNSAATVPPSNTSSRSRSPLVTRCRTKRTSETPARAGYSSPGRSRRATARFCSIATLPSPPTSTCTCWRPSYISAPRPDGTGSWTTSRAIPAAERSRKCRLGRHRAVTVSRDRAEWMEPGPVESPRGGLPAGTSRYCCLVKSSSRRIGPSKTDEGVGSWNSSRLHCRRMVARRPLVKERAHAFWRSLSLTPSA